MRINLNNMLTPEQQDAGYQLLTNGAGLDIVRPDGAVIKTLEDVKHEIQSIQYIVQQDLEMSRSGVEFENVI